MKAYIAAIGSSGDLNPMIAVGLGLRARGCDVAVLAGDWQEAAVRAAGLGFVPILEQEAFDRFTAKARASEVEGGAWVAFFIEAVLPAMDASYRHLEACADPANSVLVGSSHALGMRLAQERLGIPLVTTRLQPQGIVEMSEEHGLAIFDRLLGPAVDRFRRRIGLPPLAMPLHEWLVQLDGAVALFPSWFVHPDIDSPVQGQPTHFVRYNGAAPAPPPRELDVFLADVEPPIVFTHGTGNEHAQHFFACAAEASERLGRRAILMGPRADAAAVHPSRALPLGYHPFEDILPYTAALVHHGGVGTCAEAMRAGIPQLVVPLGFDQEQNARRVQALGLGGNLKGRVDADVLADSLRNLLDDHQLLDRCRTVSRRFPDEDAALLAADAILARARASCADLP